MADFIPWYGAMRPVGRIASVVRVARADIFLAEGTTTTTFRFPFVFVFALTARRRGMSSNARHTSPDNEQ